MANVELSATHVCITLKVLDEVLALHGSFNIPLTHVRKAEHTDREGLSKYGLFGAIKVGTAIPGRIAAGTFFTHDGVIFYDYRHADRVLVLELSHEHYAKVVVEVDPPADAQDLADRINTAIARR